MQAFAGWKSGESHTLNCPSQGTGRACKETQCSECDRKHTPSLLSKNWKECILYTSCVSAPDVGHRTRHAIWDQLPELPATDSKDACTKLIHWCTKNISEDLASKSHKEF